MSGFEVKLANGTTDLSITKTEDDYADVDGVKSDIYQCKTSVLASTFPDIDTGNFGALSEGVSLYDIINLDDFNEDTYLKSDQENAGVFTYKTSGVTLSFVYTNEIAQRKPFKVNEFATDWE